MKTLPKRDFQPFNPPVIRGGLKQVVVENKRPDRKSVQARGPAEKDKRQSPPYSPLSGASSKKKLVYNPSLDTLSEEPMTRFEVLTEVFNEASLTQFYTTQIQKTSDATEK